MRSSVARNAICEFSTDMRTRCRLVDRPVAVDRGVPLVPPLLQSDVLEAIAASTTPHHAFTRGVVVEGEAVLAAFADKDRSNRLC